eukprot:34253_1
MRNCLKHVQVFESSIFFTNVMSSPKHKQTPWILDYIKAHLGWEGNTKWDNHNCIAKIESIEWNINSNYHTLTISDTQYYIKCILPIGNINEKKQRFLRLNTFINIKNTNIQINKSFDELHMIINNWSFHSILPLFSNKSNKLTDINTNQIVSKLIQTRRKKGIISNTENVLYIRGKYNEYNYKINQLTKIYCDIMYLIEIYKSVKGFITRNDKKQIQNHFRILAESNLNLSVNVSNINDLLIHYQISKDAKFDENDLENIKTGQENEVIHTNNRKYKHKKHKKKKSDCNNNNNYNFDLYTIMTNSSSQTSDMTDINISISRSQLQNYKNDKWVEIEQSEATSMSIANPINNDIISSATPMSISTESKQDDGIWTVI